MKILIDLLIIVLFLVFNGAMAYVLALIIIHYEEKEQKSQADDLYSKAPQATEKRQ
jgi:hypothetical protein